MSFLFSKHFLMTACVLGVTLISSAFSGRRTPQTLTKPLESIPSMIDGWQGVDGGALSEETENVLNATSYLQRTYEKNDQAVSMFMAYYAMQEAGETMHSPKNCLPGSGWEVWDYTTVEVPIKGEEVSLNLYRVQHGRERLLVMYWYQTRERVVASEYFAKVCLVYDAVMKGKTSGSIVRLTMPDSDSSVAIGKDFAQRIIPLVSEVLPAG